MGLFSNIFGSGSKAAYDTSGVAAASGRAEDMWKQFQQEAVAANNPFMQSGTSANLRLADLLGLSDNAGAAGFGSLGTTFTGADLANDPGYQFRLGQGQQAIERAAAAGGSLASPATAKALMQYNQGLASDEFGDAFNRNLQSQSSLYNMLTGLSGSGQTAVGTMADINQVGTAARTGNDMALQQAILGSYQAKNAATQGAWNNLINVGTRLGTAAIMSDRRVKHNIVFRKKKKGCRLYEFSYNGCNKRYIGVMAQEVAKTHPGAVVDVGGILHVHYDKLGFPMEEVA
jgi:hypothetical protein